MRRHVWASVDGHTLALHAGYQEDELRASTVVMLGGARGLYRTLYLGRLRVPDEFANPTALARHHACCQLPRERVR